MPALRHFSFQESGSSFADNSQKLEEVAMRFSVIRELQMGLVDCAIALKPLVAEMKFRPRHNFSLVRL